MDSVDKVGWSFMLVLLYLAASLISGFTTDDVYKNDPDCKSTDTWNTTCTYQCVTDRVMFPLFFWYSYKNCFWNEADEAMNATLRAEPKKAIY